jgi:S-adenosyl-L-methionine hydrolase (adenosine-forming)
LTQAPPLITLVTDFGLRDAFVGVMKGVILSVCPEARLVDLTHEIAPGDIHAGALALQWAAPHFPPGTVHLGVVDPGVGGTRRPLVLQTSGAFFVGPDNGLLWPAASRAGEPAAWEIDLSGWDRPVSATFHGRDVFAPAAARLAAGERPEAFCQPVPDLVRLEWPRPDVHGATVRGTVIYVDRFGNAITNLTPADLGQPAENERSFTVAEQRLRGPSSAYEAAPPGSPVIVLGSAGLYEIAVNQGNAAAALGLDIGSPVEVRAAGPVLASRKRGNPSVEPG